MGCNGVILLIFRGLELLFSFIVLAGTSDSTIPLLQPPYHLSNVLNANTYSHSHT